MLKLSNAIFLLESLRLRSANANLNLWCSYIKLPDKLRNSREGLIDIKNNYNKFLLWYHIRYSNPSKTHPEMITKADKRMVNDLDYADVKFPVSEKILFALMYFVMKIIWFILLMYHIKTLRIAWICCW